jgi:hypothetical protein
MAPTLSHFTAGVGSGSLRSIRKAWDDNFSAGNPSLRRVQPGDDTVSVPETTNLGEYFVQIKSPTPGNNS